jgi:hypothetical protein
MIARLMKAARTMPRTQTAHRHYFPAAADFFRAEMTTGFLSTAKPSRRFSQVCNLSVVILRKPEKSLEYSEDRATRRLDLAMVRLLPHDEWAQRHKRAEKEEEIL